MTEKRCPACRKFKELQHFYNDGGFCVTRPSFKLCADCRERARSYFKNILADICQRVNTIKENLNLGHQ